MKKTISILLALSLTVSVGAYAFAADDARGPKEQSVTTKVPENMVKWELQIPADATIPYGQEKMIGAAKIVLVEDSTLEEKQTIEAYVNYDGYLNSASGNGQLHYTLVDSSKELGKNANEKIGEMVGKKDKNATQICDELTAKIAQREWDLATSGDYFGTVTYSSRLNDQT